MAVAVDLPFRLAAGVFEGVVAWAQANRPGWRLVPLQHGFETRLVELACSGRLDAVLGTFVSDAWIRSLLERGVCAVNVFHMSRMTSVPVVGVAERRVGMEAARHLLGEGAGSLAFLGGDGFLATRLKREGFAEGAGPGSDVVDLRSGAMLEAGLREAVARGCPLGVFCASDALAMELVAVGRSLGLKPGNDLLVIGFGDDPAASIFAGLQLSTFSIPTRKIGEKAAWVLSQQMEQVVPRPGDEVSCEMLMMAELFVRESSLASREGRLAQRARALVEARYAEPDFDVAVLARACGVSRRLLETTLRSQLDITPGQMIAARRLDAAKNLLTTTNLPIHEIAARIGFANQHHFSSWFKKQTGQAPRGVRLRKDELSGDQPSGGVRVK